MLPINCLVEQESIKERNYERIGAKIADTAYERDGNNKSTIIMEYGLGGYTMRIASECMVNGQKVVPNRVGR